MDCAICNIKLIRKRDQLEFKSRSLGRVLVPDITFFECNICGEKIISPKQSGKAIDYIKKEEQKAINRLPVGEFVTAKEAAEILEISKQAFSKNHRIKQGLIYSVLIGGRKYYHRKSVELFKENNNGKFSLPRHNVPLGYVKKLILEHMPQWYKSFVISKTIAPHGAFVPHTQEEIKSRYSGWTQFISTEKKGIRNVYK